MKHSKLTASFGIVVVAFCFAPSPAKCGTVECDQGDRIIYGSDSYEQERQITYWGVAQLNIYDYHYGTGDAAALKLVVKKDKFSEVPATSIRNHFLKEFKTFFGDLPFRDLEEGRGERLTKFQRENTGRGLDYWEGFNAAEEARRKALYGGRAGAVFCHVNIKRQIFPVLYEVSCTISAEDDLHPFESRAAKDIGFSSPEHIEKEIMLALTATLKKKKAELEKIRKCSTKQ